jgi:nitrogen fixation NifU-like protein
MLTEEIVGKTLDELKQISKDDILDMMGIQLGPVRLKCALLSLKVLKAGAYGLTDWPGDVHEPQSNEAYSRGVRRSKESDE